MPKVYSYYSEELLLKFSIDNSAGANEPSWQETENYPPLPPREAIEISRLTLLLILKDYPWAEPEFHSCALKRTSEYEGNWWYYDIDWMVWPPEQDGSDRSGINVPVMLNGKVPPYEVFKYEDRVLAWKT
ncbi:hypothetical protein [Chromobacterium amazonense]|uniref:hypothetical protein n=1 Tax=Chromobacterium amazonense TaxID=1382803 RepID=UPI0011138EC3|nr:hypothetical protein [Chromobacterium amazonense]